MVKKSHVSPLPEKTPARRSTAMVSKTGSRRAIATPTAPAPTLRRSVAMATPVTAKQRAATPAPTPALRTAHVTPMVAATAPTRRRRKMATPLLRFDVSSLPALESRLLGDLAPSKLIAASPALLTAYNEAREVLAADVRRFWGGIARRSNGIAADPELLRELADLLRDTGEAYKRDAEFARTPDWQTAAMARASLYTTAWRAIRRMLRGGAETAAA